MRICAYSNDIGITKKVNQDGILIKEASTPNGDVTFLVVCDGMGGLSYGEVASGMLIRCFDNWFDNELAYVLAEDNLLSVIKNKWDSMIKAVSYEIMEYGRQRDVQLGTTCTALLVLDNNEYIIAHVGDSRVYQFREKAFSVLTTDHTVIAKEIREGKITIDQAKTDPRRNMLLQAIGASEYLEVDYLTGNVLDKDTYIICSDGFRHKITDDELISKFCIDSINKDELERVVNDTVSLVKERGEQDNISCIALSILEG